jgi:hypothetical protein
MRNNGTLNGILRDFRRKVRPNFAAKGYQFQCLNRFHDNALWIVRIFYIFSLILSYRLIAIISHRNPGSADFLWPVAWLDIATLKPAFSAIPIVLFIISATLVIWPTLRSLRALFSLLVLFTSAIDNSFGAINHGWHIWFWVSCILIFLPGHQSTLNRAYKLTTLSIIVYIQAAVLLTYSMAGTLKLLAGISSLIIGESGNFSPTGFSSLLADRMVAGSGTTVLGDFFIDNPLIAFPLFPALILIQTFSFPIALWVSLHRIWGLVLIVFHLGTGLLMDIYFETHVFWLALFLVCSPFTLDRPPWNQRTQNGLNR